jgi:drug/metabolite transporter (DMT)-like permease
MFAAAAAIPLADATAISFLNPIFGMILAIPLLGERVGKWRWLAAVIAFAGALILIRPGEGGIDTGALLALGAALALGLELIFIKRLSGRERPLQILLVNNTIGLVIATVAVIWVWQPPTPAQWAGMAAIGTVMAAAQFCFVSAMARADASFVTPFSYLTLVFAALYDAALFGTLPTPLSLLGAATIIAGAALLAWRERINRRPA